MLRFHDETSGAMHRSWCPRAFGLHRPSEAHGVENTCNARLGRVCRTTPAAISRSGSTKLRSRESTPVTGSCRDDHSDRRTQEVVSSAQPEIGVLTVRFPTYSFRIV